VSSEVVGVARRSIGLIAGPRRCDDRFKMSPSDSAFS
jgi:hypothetical protein